METEEWRDVVGYEGQYSVSNLGRLKGHDRYVDHGQYGKKRFIKGKMIQARLNRYSGNVLAPIGKPQKPLHHLVLEAFVGPRPEGMIGLHHDDDPNNNNVTNLRWGTYQDNADDRKRNAKEYPRINVRIEPQLYDEVERIANESDTTISAVVREAVRQFIAGYQAAVEKA